MTIHYSENDLNLCFLSLGFVGELGLGLVNTFIYLD